MKIQYFLKHWTLSYIVYKQYNLDALLISTHVPGLSAYNQVEKRMDPLSETLSRLLLPHETFETQLDSSRKTFKTNLEKVNFKAASELLVKVWQEIVFDNFHIVADYVENVSKDFVDLNEKWISVHCRISKYFLKIVQCNNSRCCDDFRTTWKGATFYQLLFQ